MPAKKSGRKRKIAAALVVAFVVAAIGAGLWLRKKPDGEHLPPSVQERIRVPLQPAPVIDYRKVEEDPASKDLMAGRKAEYGVDKGVDLIVKAGESFKVGETTVSMEEILERIRLKKGELLEKNIGDMGGRIRETTAFPGLRERPEASRSPDPLRQPLLPERGGVFGIYVVRASDNVWNIHFAFLRDYFARKAVTLSPRSDEPDRRGKSSGVGKLLKFSENMVYIYNLREKRLSHDLNLIHPLEKIVVFDMGAIFSVLDRIDYRNLHQVQFDGQIIWLPAEKWEVQGQRPEDRNGKIENRN